MTCQSVEQTKPATTTTTPETQGSEHGWLIGNERESDRTGDRRVDGLSGNGVKRRQNKAKDNENGPLSQNVASVV